MRKESFMAASDDIGRYGLAERPVSVPGTLRRFKLARHVRQLTLEYGDGSFVILDLGREVLHEFRERKPVVAYVAPDLAHRIHNDSLLDGDLRFDRAAALRELHPVGGGVRRIPGTVQKAIEERHL